MRWRSSLGRRIHKRMMESGTTAAEVGQVQKNARKSRCSNLRKKSTSGKSSACEVEADVIVHREDEEIRANHLEV